MVNLKPGARIVQQMMALDPKAGVVSVRLWDPLQYTGGPYKPQLLRVANSVFDHVSAGPLYSGKGDWVAAIEMAIALQNRLADWTIDDKPEPGKVADPVLGLPRPFAPLHFGVPEVAMLILLGAPATHVAPSLLNAYDYTDQASIKLAVDSVIPNSTRADAVVSGFSAYQVPDRIGLLETLDATDPATITAQEAIALRAALTARQLAAGLIPGPSGSGIYIEKQKALHTLVAKSIAGDCPVVLAVKQRAAAPGAPLNGLVPRHEYAVLEAGPIPAAALPPGAVQPPGGQILGFRISNPWGLAAQVLPGTPALSPATDARRANLGYGRRYIGIGVSGAFTSAPSNNPEAWVELDEVYRLAEFSIGPSLNTCPAARLGSSSGLQN